MGAIRGLRRCRASPRGADTVLLILLAATLAGYALFTWRNPWFVTVKASFLLGLAVPFAYYASEGLAVVMRPGGWRAAPFWLWLALLVAAVALTFWHGLVFAKLDDPGLQWNMIAPGRR